MKDEKSNAAGVDRRSFLGAAGAALGVGLLPAGAQANQPPAGRDKPTRAKNLILAIADGMSLGCLAIADLAMQRRHHQRSRWVEWMNEPNVRSGLNATTPAVGLLTDSAASASGWGIGQRVANGSICVMPDGSEPAPLFLRAKQAGKRIGLVTTSYLPDATPAAMIANTPKRSQRERIAKQMIDRGVDIGIGGGSRYFNEQQSRDAGVSWAPTFDELRRIVQEGSSERVFGLLADGELPHSLDRSDRDPSLRELATTALEHLSDSPNGFCLMVENEHTDEAGHNNDAASTLADMLEFESTLDLLIDFARTSGDTLLIATTDHACGNPGFSTYGKAGNPQFEKLLGCRRSFVWIFMKFGKLNERDRTAAALASIVQEACNVSLNEAEVATLDRALKKNRVDPYEPRNRLTSVLGSVLANHLGVVYTGPNHATDHVLVTAMGPGADRLPAVGHHTDVHDLMTAALGLPAP